MPRKSRTRSGQKCRVTFELPASVDADEIHIVGEFNEWSRDATPLERRSDGRFTTTLTLDAGRTYRYRFLIDGERWENDWQADEYQPNEHGGEDSVITL